METLAGLLLLRSCFRTKWDWDGSAQVLLLGQGRNEQNLSRKDPIGIIADDELIRISDE